MIIPYKWIDTKINILRLQIDYELMTLYDAIQENDEITKETTKARLIELSHQLKQWEENIK